MTAITWPLPIRISVSAPYRYPSPKNDSLYWRSLAYKFHQTIKGNPIWPAALFSYRTSTFVCMLRNLWPFFMVSSITRMFTLRESTLDVRAIMSIKTLRLHINAR